MKRVALLLFVFAGTLALHAAPRVLPHHKFAHADGCSVSTLNCDGTPQEGTIATGDCTVTDGTRYDQWQVFGTAGDEITVTLDALDTTLTDPFIDLEPPAADTTALTPFVISGGATVTMKYIFSSTGNWSINVGSNDVTGSGRYRLRTFCNHSTSTDPQNCEPQPATCDELWGWGTTPTSCTFTNSNAVYAPFDIYLSAGDTLQVQMTSNDFDPAISIYKKSGNGSALASAFGFQAVRDALLSVRVSTAGTYELVAFDGTFGSTGTFALLIECNSTCVPVTIAGQPQSQTSQGGAASLSVSPLGAGPFTYQWYEGKPTDTSHPVSNGRSATLQLATVSASTSYWVRVTNACGSADSNVAFVTLVTPGKHRIAPHS